MMSITLYGLAVSALVVSWRADRQKTRRALKIAGKSLAGLAPRILGLVTLVGLVLALVPPDVITGLFTVRGIGGYFLVAGIGSVITMPGPIAFPLAGSLLRLGAPPATLATFVTTLTMVGIVTAPMEISCFGRRFTVMRQVLSFLTAVAIGLLMGVFL